jgi:branched-chain amino acid transport system substrate-binding protein
VTTINKEFCLKTIQFVLLLLLALCGVGGVVAQDAQPTTVIPQPYRIGVFLSLSGPFASLGQPANNTLRMIVREVNAQGGVLGPDGERHSVSLVVYDDESNPEVAAERVAELIALDNVAIIIGGSTTASSLPAVPLANAAEVPFISLAGSSEIVRAADGSQQPWVFKATQNEPRTAEVILDWLQARGIQRVAAVAVDNTYGNTSMGVSGEMFADAGIEVVYEGRFAEGNEDFEAIIAEIGASDAEAVIAHATAMDPARLTEAYAASGLLMPMVHTPGVGNPAFLAMTGDAAESMYASIGKLLVASQLPVDDPQRELLMTYANHYTSTYLEPVSTFGGHAWDAMQLTLKAFEMVGPDSAALRDTLENDLQGFVGITGVYNITPEDHSGVGPGAMVLVQIIGSTWRYVPAEAYATTTP